MDYSKLTLGELLSSSNKAIRRNAVGILKQLQNKPFNPFDIITHIDDKPIKKACDSCGKEISDLEYANGTGNCLECITKSWEEVECCLSCGQRAYVMRFVKIGGMTKLISGKCADCGHEGNDE